MALFYLLLPNSLTIARDPYELFIIHCPHYILRNAPCHIFVADFGNPRNEWSTSHSLMCEERVMKWKGFYLEDISAESSQAVRFQHI